MKTTRSWTFVAVLALVIIALAAGGREFLSTGRGAFESLTVRVGSSPAPVATPSLGALETGPGLSAEQTAEETPEQIARQVAVFDEIVRSKNDNDPRFDTELRELGRGARREFRQRYAALAPERRNERGTIVFFLGRNLRDPEDFRFLKKVLEETPCLSLNDCSSAPSKVDPHLSDIDERTLAYPSLVALYAVEQMLAHPGLTESDRARCREVIEVGLRSPVPVVAAKARKLSEADRK